MHSAYPRRVPMRSIMGPETPFMMVYASMKANTIREYSISPKFSSLRSIGAATESVWRSR